MNTDELYDIFCNEILPKGNFGYSCAEIAEIVGKSVSLRPFSNIAQPGIGAYLVMKDLFKLKHSPT